MPRAAVTAKRPLPDLEATLSSLNVEVLKWFAAPLPGQTPGHKAELVNYLLAQLRDPAMLGSLLDSMTTEQRDVIAEVSHPLDGVYDAEVIHAKYPSAAVPVVTDGYY